LAQRAPRERALALTAAGFPGLSLEHERAALNSQAAEGELGRLGLAYLQGEHGAGAPPPEQAAAVAEMLRQLDVARPQAARAELMGPVSAALQIVDEQERPLAYSPPLREAIAQHLILRATWLHEQADSHTGSIVVCLDEPFLDALSSPFCPLDWHEGLDLLARVLADTPGPRGLCIAGTLDWNDILSLPADLVCFDAYEHGAGLIRAASAVAGFLERGGVIAWGVVPTDPAALAQERAETLARRFESTVEYLAAAGNLSPVQIRAAALISTSSGLAHLPAELAARAAALCGEVSAHLRARYQLEH
ncbi:MAG: hypothetical protein HGA45_28460, partial [Chloroflexales bacterium]|nr:hypothetical protein [Chloroflexales bacterium]